MCPVSTVISINTPIYLWIQIQNAYFRIANNFSYGFLACAIQVLFEFAVFDEPVLLDIRLEYVSRNEMIVFAVDFVATRSSRRMRHGNFVQ